MGLVERVQRWMRGGEPTLLDYETYQQAAGNAAESAESENYVEPNTPDSAFAVLGKVGPASGIFGGGTSGAPGNSAGNANPQTSGSNPAGTYKMQQSYDALLQTFQELRSELDGQSRRQEELFNRLSTLPQAAETLPQASKMQADMLKMINDRLAMHAEQQRKVSSVINGLGAGTGTAGAGTGGGTGSVKKEYAEALQSIREQIEMGNEIDQQLVESFNRFSMMIDRLQLANQHAVDALQQVRDSYAASAMQMQEWIEKSRSRSSWMIGGAFLMAAASLIIALMLLAKFAGV